MPESTMIVEPLNVIAIIKSPFDLRMPNCHPSYN
jgi:hypothetical protein